MRSALVFGWFRPAQLFFNSLANELRTPVRADECVNLLKSLFRQANEYRLVVQRWSPHALGISRYRKLSQTVLLGD